MRTPINVLILLFLIACPLLQTELMAQSKPLPVSEASIMETGVRDWMLTEIKPYIQEKKKVKVQPKVREWTDAEGKFSVGAELLTVSKDGKSVTLRRDDNKKEISLELTKLSIKDREFVQEYQKKVDDDFSNEIDLNPTSSKKQYELGVRYTLGLGIPQDEEKAFEWLEKASRSNYVPAVREYGRALLRKAGKDKYILDIREDENLNQATKLLMKAADKGDIDAKYHLGEFWSRHRMSPASFVKLYDAKTNGCSDAEKILTERKPSIEELDSIYNDGDNYVRTDTKTTKKKNENIKKAISCFQLGSYYGHPKSQYRLAAYFIDGDGVKKDPHTAILLLEEAESGCREDAKLGNGKALALLGEIYILKAYIEEAAGRKGGPEYKKHIDVAIGFLEMAIEKGDAEALYWRGYLKIQNIGSTGKRQEGLRMLRQAAELGDLSAIDFVSDL